MIGNVEARLASLRLQPDLQGRIKAAQLNSQERDQLSSTIRRSEATAL